jgi:hypothetical protein
MLTIGNVRGAGFSPHHILDLLRLAPSLIECSLEPHFGIHVDEILVFPKLCRLMFGECTMSPFFGCKILNHISLPSLEMLLANAMPNTLLSFLQKSSPPLLELVLGKESDFPPLAECLHLIPDLRQLELWFPTVEALFAGLTESPTLLPHINALVLHVTEDDISDSLWAALNGALLTHRTEFQLVDITVPGRLPDSKMPSPDIIAALRALAVNGVQIQLRLIRPIWDGVTNFNK